MGWHQMPLTNDHPFSTYTKFSEKVELLDPLKTFFVGNFASAVNGSSFGFYPVLSSATIFVLDNTVFRVIYITLIQNW